MSFVINKHTLELEAMTPPTYAGLVSRSSGTPDVLRSRGALDVFRVSRIPGVLRVSGALMSSGAVGPWCPQGQWGP